MDVDGQMPLDLDGLAVPTNVIHAGSLTTGHITTPPITSWVWNVWVPGVPAPQGSKQAIPAYSRGKPTGRIFLKESSSARLDTWRTEVARVARESWPGPDPYPSPVLLGCAFLLPPFKATKAGDWPVGSRTGDLDKLMRAVGDALTGQVWVDDRQVVGYLPCGKRFARTGEEPGCSITIRPAGQAQDAL